MTTVRSERAEASRNERGSAEDRRRRKVWLVEAFRSDVDLIVVLRGDGTSAAPLTWPAGYPCRFDLVSREPTCRCYRCGELLTVDTVTPDRIVPGCQGGTYRRNNLRPACLACNTLTGAQLGAARRQKGKRT